MAKNNNRNNNNNDDSKKSGCTLIKNGKNDRPVMHGWNISKKRGMISFVASPRKDASKRRTKNENWENWAVKVSYDNGLPDVWINGLYDLEQGRLHMPDINMIANPNTSSGKTKNGKTVKGYFGKRI